MSWSQNYMADQISDCEAELEKEVRYLQKLASNWNGEDRSGILEDKVVEWEREMREVEEHIEELEQELQGLRLDAETITDRELASDLSEEG